MKAKNTLADQANLRIAITDSKMIFHQGFSLQKRTIFYDEVVDIVFQNSSKYDHLNRSRKRKLTVGPMKPELIINLRNDDYLNY